MMDVEFAKLKLKLIIEQARLKRERIETQKPEHTNDAPDAAESRPEPQQPVAPEVQAEVVPTAPEPEPLPDYNDGTWIEERTAELVFLNEPNGDSGEIITREVLSGRFVSSYRRRTPADGSEEFVIISPRSRRKPVEEKVEFPSWGESGRVDPRVRARFEQPQRGWSLNRNSGCLRANGDIEP